MTEKKKEKKTQTKKTGLELLREPFEAHQIGKLPKPFEWQTTAYKKDKSTGGLCPLCNQYHHSTVTHLDYVGHAAMTDRLLECDPNWIWEPMALTPEGLPLYSDGGLWIKLTVCGQSRLGFGDANGKSGTNAIKEIIGDGIRNAAMRFGAALDLWHKGDLHDNANSLEEEPKVDAPLNAPKIPSMLKEQLHTVFSMISKETTGRGFNSIVKEYKGTLEEITDKYPQELTDDKDGNEGFTSLYERKKAEIMKAEKDKAEVKEPETPKEDDDDPFVNPLQ